MSTVHVVLNDQQNDLAQAAGTAWRTGADRAHRPEPRGTPHKRPKHQNDLDAARGQLGFAVTYRRPWVGCYHEHPHPIQPHVTGRKGVPIVIYTTPIPTGELILKEALPDHCVMVLARGTKLDWEYAGWITVGEGRAVAVWRTDVRYPANFIAPSALHPMPPAPEHHDQCPICATPIVPGDEHPTLGVHVACLPWRVRNAHDALKGR